MAKKRIFQLGLEPQYIAHVTQLWMDGQFDTDIRIRKARTEGLVVIELTDVALTDRLTKTIRIPHINIKDVNA